VSASLVAKLHAVSLTASATFNFALDWKGGPGKLVLEGLSVVGNGSIFLYNFTDTFGELLSVGLPGYFPLLTADGAYDFTLPPGRLSFQVASSGDPGDSLTVGSLHIYTI